MLPVVMTSGNTAMIRLLLGLNAWVTFAAPFGPVAKDPSWFWGREPDMDFSGLVYTLPSGSNYVSGDIISGLLTVDLRKSDSLTLFFELGTNGEPELGCRNWIVAGASGPALQGYISRHGPYVIRGSCIPFCNHLLIQKKQEWRR